MDSTDDHFRREVASVELKDDVAGTPHPEGEAMTVLDLYVTVVSRFRPRRQRFYEVAPRLGEVVRRVDAWSVPARPRPARAARWSCRRRPCRGSASAACANTSSRGAKASGRKRRCWNRRGRTFSPKHLRRVRGPASWPRPSSSGAGRRRGAAVPRLARPGAGGRPPAASTRASSARIRSCAEPRRNRPSSRPSRRSSRAGGRAGSRG